MTADRRATACSIAVLLISWEVVGLFDLVASGALPAPSEIAVQFWQDRTAYPPHVGATLWAATLGFVIGNAAIRE